MKDLDWENKFDELLSQHLIEVPEDFYNEEIAFESPDEINIFLAGIEEENLF